MSDDAIGTDVALGRLEAAGARLLLVSYVDLAGITRARAVPLRRAAGLARSGLGLSDVWSIATVDDQFAMEPPFDTPSGDMRALPDLAAAAPLASEEWGWAPLMLHDQELQPKTTCPRHALVAVEARAAAQGLTFQVAIESELTLFDAEGRPAHDGPAHSINALLMLQEFSAALVEALERADIPVETVHPEYSPGQYEISMAPGSPVTAADRLVRSRIVAKEVARRFGLAVSFAPKVGADMLGNGAHIHLSPWRDGRNGLAGAHIEPSADAAGLLGGIVGHLPELMAVLAPSVPSYERLEPGHWAGAFACWGVENREAAVRLIPGSAGVRERAANVEVKCADGAANPYLAIALVLGAALDGIANATPAPVPVLVDPGTMTAEERRAAAIVRLPATLAEATDRFDGSALAREVLGPDLHGAVAAVRRLEWQRLGHLGSDQLAEIHRWAY